MPKKINQLKKMLITGKIDTSDFILIALDLIQNENNAISNANSIDELLNQIKTDYFELNYQGALEQLLHAAQKLNNPKIAEIFESSIKKAVKNSRPEQVESRRYFENWLATEHWKSLNQTASKDSMDRFAKFMTGANLLYAQQHPFSELKKVNNLADMEMVIAAMRGFGENTESILQRETAMRSEENNTPLSKFKDRGKKRSSDDVGYTMNPGIIKANMPMPNNERRETAIKGSISDSFLINRELIGGYSATTINTPFVNSVSGTAYTLAAVLDQYIEQNKKEPYVQEDINNIVAAFVTFTCKSGFHSLPEMVDVLNTPEVTSVFNKHHLHINYSCPQQILVQAIRASAKYVETRQSQKTVLRELPTHSLFKRHADQPTNKTPYPKELQPFVRENKQSGPRIAKALQTMYEKGLEEDKRYSPEQCREIAQHYLNYAKLKHPNANTQEVKKFISTMNEIIQQNAKTTEERIAQRSGPGIIL